MKSYLQPIMELTNQVWNIIRTNRLFTKGQTILVGLSGGPDSVALTNILNQINNRFKMNWHLVIAHINHQMRGQKSDQDERFVRRMATDLNLPIHIIHKNILSLSKKHRQSIEETARYERYRFFDQIARQTARKHRSQTISITVGHNLDDNAETVLFRIIRGTGLKGLRSIRPKRKLFDDPRFHLVRPLVFTSRQEIISYLKTQKIPYCIDHTNKDKKMLRNRIRHELLPLLKHYNPAICQHLVQLSETASTYYDYVNNMAQSRMRRHHSGKSLSVKTLKKEHPVIQAEIMTKTLENIEGTKALTHNHYLSLLKLINSPRPQGRGSSSAAKSGGEVYLPNNIIARVTAGKLIIKRSNK